MPRREGAERRLADGQTCSRQIEGERERRASSRAAPDGSSSTDRAGNGPGARFSRRLLGAGQVAGGEWWAGGRLVRRGFLLSPSPDRLTRTGCVAETDSETDLCGHRCGLGLGLKPPRRRPGIPRHRSRPRLPPPRQERGGSIGSPAGGSASSAMFSLD
ncbi:hypothetical protein B2J93_8376 [Marssonina coronariae]|uniref:Uncharacterized protein n=1 Tax=Diplocarpon coronariae TaxID=2795749 RepID=A0A218ZD14_9HELO|nr:hypothetical protein B2J93_8376 [Marssonina coronariae]